MPTPIEPSDVVAAVEGYVARELSDAVQYENRAPLDESGIYSLHSLAADVYARGFADGAHAAHTRELARRNRERGA